MITNTVGQVIYVVGVLKKRPLIPLDCPPFLRRLLQECWHDDPECRPAFTAVHKQLLVSTILESPALVQVLCCELLTLGSFPTCASRALLCVQEEHCRISAAKPFQSVLFERAGYAPSRVRGGT